jgi:hypothetical protein
VQIQLDLPDFMRIGRMSDFHPMHTPPHPSLSRSVSQPSRRRCLAGALGLLACLSLSSAGLARAGDDRDALLADLSHFVDSSCAELKPEVTTETLKSFRSEILRKVAADLLAGNYDTTYRAAAYQAYPSPRELGRKLKLGDGFSRYEGITGMVLEKGENIVMVGPTGGKSIELLVPFWMRQPPEGVEPTKDPNGWGLKRQTLALSEGPNVVELERGGNVYVAYFDDDAASAPAIRVHFPGGKVNGYFDAAKHTNEDWDRLLDEAVSPILDARGTHIQVAYPVEFLQIHTRSRGLDLIRNYDTLLKHHYAFMGLTKYDKIPVNRILSRVNFNYYMFRDGDGVAYLGTRNVMGMVANPDRVIQGDPCWGFSHEAGHVLQMRPQITWGGLTEVSVNLFSLYTGGQMGNSCRLKAQKNYSSARRNIIDAGISYLDTPDVFDRLVPFWQLHLYFERKGRPDFYADVMEEMRRRPDAGHGDESIRNQFDFIKIVCDVSGLDLREFFQKWGFLRTGEIKLNDYRPYHFHITQEMVDDVISYLDGRKLPKPEEELTLIES